MLHSIFRAKLEVTWTFTHLRLNPYVGSSSFFIYEQAFFDFEVYMDTNLTQFMHCCDFYGILKMLVTQFILNSYLFGCKKAHWGTPKELSLTKDQPLRSLCGGWILHILRHVLSQTPLNQSFSEP